MITKENLTRLEDVSTIFGIKEFYEFTNKEDDSKIEIGGNANMGYSVSKVTISKDNLICYYKLYKKGFYLQEDFSTRFEDLDSALRALNKELGYTI